LMVMLILKLWIFSMQMPAHGSDPMCSFHQRHADFLLQRRCHLRDWHCLRVVSLRIVFQSTMWIFSYHVTVVPADAAPAAISSAKTTLVSCVPRAIIHRLVRTTQIVTNALQAISALTSTCHFPHLALKTHFPSQAKSVAHRAVQRARMQHSAARHPHILS
jgi:hypothetical protein